MSGGTVDGETGVVGRTTTGTVTCGSVGVVGIDEWLGVDDLGCP